MHTLSKVKNEEEAVRFLAQNFKYKCEKEWEDFYKKESPFQIEYNLKKFMDKDGNIDFRKVKNYDESIIRANLKKNPELAKRVVQPPINDDSNSS